VAEYLQDSGYCVLEASDVAEAKAALSADISVDVVFSDVNMPGAEDGFVLANWIHQHRPDTKVLLTSGFPHGNEKTRELCEPLLAKPYSPLSMLRRIQSLLERR
jgi:CheY-like chemotaxis protein